MISWGSKMQAEWDNTEYGRVTVYGLLSTCVNGNLNDE